MTQSPPNTPSPDELLRVSRSVAASLQGLNQVIDQQRKAIASLSEDLMRAMVDLVKDANSIAQNPAPETGGSDAGGETPDGEAKLRRLAAAAAAATASSGLESNCAEPTDGNELEAGAREVLLIAYKNAVEAQQQLNVTANAALVQGVSAIYSVVTAATGRVESETLKALLDSFTPSSNDRAG